jgi:LacI family transcriptional regulator
MLIRMASTQMSIREVAARAGVSLGTVSKAFDENAKVSTDTRERVRRAAKELGYHPSAVARAMVRKRMDTIGVILPPNMVSPVRSAFYSTIFHALLQAAAPRDQDIAICTGLEMGAAMVLSCSGSRRRATLSRHFSTRRFLLCS